MGLVSLSMGRVPPEDLARVQGIGKRLAPVSDRQDVVYRFGVIQEKAPNAFTLPGATIYVHTGLLSRATDDELAAVLAHEIGHVAARHVAKHLQADLGLTVAMQLALAAGGSPEAARVVKSLYGLFRNGFSRRDELEADRLAIRYARKAGYNPWAMVSFFEKLEAEESEGPLKQVFVWQSTHPLTSERIARAKEELARWEPQAFCPTCGRTYGPKARFCTRDGMSLKRGKGAP
jgi:predicted Zn-dependent protease